MPGARPQLWRRAPSCVPSLHLRRGVCLRPGEFISSHGSAPARRLRRRRIILRATPVCAKDIGRSCHNINFSTGSAAARVISEIDIAVSKQLRVVAIFIIRVPCGCRCDMGMPMLDGRALPLRQAPAAHGSMRCASSSRAVTARCAVCIQSVPSPSSSDYAGTCGGCSKSVQAARSRGPSPVTRGRDHVEITTRSHGEIARRDLGRIPGSSRVTRLERAPHLAVQQHLEHEGRRVEDGGGDRDREDDENVLGR